MHERDDVTDEALIVGIDACHARVCDAQRAATEALRLGRALAELMPDEAEVHGLLAMMLLHDARREARFRDGELVLLADQDRSLWDTAQIAAGRAELDRALALLGRGPYAIQAAIASLHADEPRDWPQIAALYGELARLTDSPVVELSRAVAVAEAQGPEAGLRIVDRLDLDDIGTCTRRGASCCVASFERTRPAMPTAEHWRWSTTTPSGASSNGGLRSWKALLASRPTRSFASLPRVMLRTFDGGGGGNRTRVLERPSGASTSVACGESRLEAPTGGGPLGQPGFDVRRRPPGRSRLRKPANDARSPAAGPPGRAAT